MSKGSNKLPPAVKHGGYARTTLFPGEDAAAFKKLHDAVVAELNPLGPMEEDIARDIAGLLWRKQNLRVFRFAEQVKSRHSAIFAHCTPPLQFNPGLNMHAPETRSPEELQGLKEAAEKEAHEELGEASLQLVDMGKEITIEYFEEELSIVERINGDIDRRIKSLLLVRGVKSMSLSPSSAPWRSPKELPQRKET